MGKFIDLTGEKYGRLAVLNIAYKAPDRVYFWNCLCDCGKYCIIRGSTLRKSNGTKSCGCLHKEAVSLIKRKHGLSKNTTAEYRAWKAMKKRCYNKSYVYYNEYGGRGIKVCDRWLNSFENFLEDMGKRPSNKHSLDRYPNVNGDYEPENCRWATQKQQCSNKRNNKWYEYNGQKMILSDWAIIFNAYPSNISKMLKIKSFEDVYNHYLIKK